MMMINVIYFALAAVAMLAFFRITKILAFRSTIVQNILPALNILELILWTVIAFWSARMFLSTRSYYPHLVIILALLVAFMVTWFYIKDIVAGFLFRVRHNPIKGQTLRCESLKGSIRRLGISQVTVETEDGQWLRVPYSSIITRSLSLHSLRQTTPGETTLELGIETLKNPQHTEQRLRTILAQSPWCIVSKPLTIQFIPHENKIKISFFLIDPIYLQPVKDRLISCLDELKSY
jgi:small-conductance mechanosensitive channel